MNVETNILTRTAKHGHANVLQLMLYKGAAAFHPEKHMHADENRALRWAAANGHIACVELLIKAGADVHAGRDAALRYEARNGHVDCVALLEKQKFLKKYKTKSSRELVHGK